MKNTKPRNHIVLAMIRQNKSTQVHDKSTKAKRKQSKITLRKSLGDKDD